MHVIGHEAVRGYFKTAFNSRSHELLTDQVDCFWFSEHRRAAISAECEEIVVFSGVRQVGMMLRVWVRHDGCWAVFMPRFFFRLKAEATSFTEARLPPEGGSHRIKPSAQKSVWLPALAGRSAEKCVTSGFSQKVRRKVRGFRLEPEGNQPSSR